MVRKIGQQALVARRPTAPRPRFVVGLPPKPVWGDPQTPLVLEQGVDLFGGWAQWHGHCPLPVPWGGRPARGAALDVKMEAGQAPQDRCQHAVAGNVVTGDPATMRAIVRFVHGQRRMSSQVISHDRGSYLGIAATSWQRCCRSMAKCFALIGGGGRPVPRSETPAPGGRCGGFRGGTFEWLRLRSL